MRVSYDNRIITLESDDEVDALRDILGMAINDIEYSTDEIDYRGNNNWEKVDQFAVDLANLLEYTG